MQPTDNAVVSETNAIAEIATSQVALDITLLSQRQKRDVQGVMAKMLGHRVGPPRHAADEEGRPAAAVRDPPRAKNYLLPGALIFLGRARGRQAGFAARRSPSSATPTPTCSATRAACGASTPRRARRGSPARARQEGRRPLRARDSPQGPRLLRQPAQSPGPPKRTPVVAQDFREALARARGMARIVSLSRTLLLERDRAFVFQRYLEPSPRRGGADAPGAREPPQGTPEELAHRPPPRHDELRRARHAASRASPASRSASSTRSWAPRSAKSSPPRTSTR